MFPLLCEDFRVVSAYQWPQKEGNSVFRGRQKAFWEQTLCFIFSVPHSRKPNDLERWLFNDTRMMSCHSVQFKTRSSKIFSLWGFGCLICPHINSGHHVLKVNNWLGNEMHFAQGFKSKCCTFKNNAPHCALLTTSFLLLQRSTALSIIQIMLISLKNWKSLSEHSFSIIWQYETIGVVCYVLKCCPYETKNKCTIIE